MGRGQVFWIIGFTAVCLVASGNVATGVVQPSPVPTATTERAVLERYCFTCHNESKLTGGLALDSLDLSDVGEHAEV